jgi:hypothetical protein
MRSLALSVALLVGLCLPSSAQNGQGQNDNSQGQNGQGQNYQGQAISGAPGPIAGVGLPVLAVGYGVYWLIKRRRKAAGK